MFISTYEHKLNKKNQLTLPAKMREALERQSDSRNLFLFRADSRCVYVYTAERMAAALEQLKERFHAEGAASDFRRTVVSRITEIEPDPNGRFVLPEPVRQALGIKQDVVWLGNIDRIELWAKERWDEMQARETATYDEKLQEMLLQELEH